MQFINSKDAPKAVGPYSQAVKVDNFLFCSGQIGLDPNSGQIVEGGVLAELQQVLKNIKAVLTEANYKLEDVVKAELFLADIKDFAEINKIYEAFFGSHKPARNTYQVAKLPLDSKIEISITAYKTA
jgi:2-iminobutanoate/2-iminopropanoate deaminase